MNAQQIAAAKVGDNVTLTSRDRVSKGRITQSTPRWFMVTWEDGTPQVVRREQSSVTARLHLDVAPKPKRTEPNPVLIGYGGRRWGGD